jgi:glycosyltransferase involved in cell wall biosynthesis
MMDGSKRAAVAGSARVLFLSPSGALGGAERCLLDLVASLRAHVGTDDLDLGLVAGRDGPLLGEAESLGMRIVRLPMSDRLAAVGDSAIVAHGARSLPAFGRRAAGAALDTAEYVYRLGAAISRFSPSVVHSNGIKMHLLAAAASVRAPLLWHIRDFISERPLVSRAMRACAWRAHAGIAISHAVCEDAGRVLPRLPLSVIHDGIDTDLFSPSGPVADLDALAGSDPAPAGTLRVGLVATYARWKGHEVFIHAAKLVKGRLSGPNVRFYVVGGPIYDTAASQYTQDELRALAGRLGIESDVRFVSFQGRIDEVYRALDIVVHTGTRREPFGRTIAEAMATGKPVVMSRESGAAELCSNTVDSVCIASGDAEAVARAVHELILDSPRRARLGSAARSAATKRFSRGRLARQVLDAYREAGCTVDGLLAGRSGVLSQGRSMQR